MEHVCVTLEGPEARRAAIAAFVGAGRERQERCACVVSREDAAVLAGDLTIAGHADAGGERLFDWIRALAREGPVRIAADMAEVEPGASAGEVGRFEARLTTLIAQLPVTLLCVYDRARFTRDVLVEVVATHPSIAIDELVCRNVCFVPPEDYLAEDRADRALERLLENLRRSALTENGLRQSEERYRTLCQHLLDVHEVERRSLALELHDHLGQSLSAVRMSLLAVENARPAQRSRAVAEAITLADETIELVRTLALDLRPSVLDDLGLAAAVRSLVARQALEGRLEVDLRLHALERPLGPQLETAAFRLVQEALTNVLRHAKARRVQVELAIDGDGLDVMVRDDGRGFDVGAERARAASRGSLGLISMEERVLLAGGRLELESNERGTTVRARLPLSREGSP